MFKREIKPLQQSMVDSISKTINKHEYIEEKAARPMDSAEGDVKPQDISGEEEVKADASAKKAPARKGDQAKADSMEKVKEEVELEEKRNIKVTKGSKERMVNKQELGTYKQMGWQEVKEAAEMDPVNPKAVKKKFDDRKDKDIDNDGDTDSSDEYLHKRRKAISKALESKKPNASVDESAELEGLDEAKEVTPKDVESYLVKTGVNPKDAKEAVKKGFGYASKKYGGSTYKSAVKKIAEVIWSLHEEVELDEAKDTHKTKDGRTAKKGLWYNINKKKKRGEKPLPKGHEDRPTEQDFENARKTTKEEVVSEAKDDYTINHKTFSSAVQHALEMVKKRGFEVDDDEWDRKVAMGPRKPGKGKTNRYTIALTKGGKPTRKNLQMQVYYDEGRYELNMYVS